MNLAIFLQNSIMYNVSTITLFTSQFCLSSGIEKQTKKKHEHEEKHKVFSNFYEFTTLFWHYWFEFGLINIMENRHTFRNTMSSHFKLWKYLWGTKNRSDIACFSTVQLLHGYFTYLPCLLTVKSSVRKAEYKDCGSTVGKIVTHWLQDKACKNVKNYVFKLIAKSSMYSRGTARYLAKLMGESSFYDIEIISLFNQKIIKMS